MTFDTDKIPGGWCELTPKLAPWGLEEVISLGEWKRISWTAYVDGGGGIKKPQRVGILKWIYYVRPRDPLQP